MGQSLEKVISKVATEAGLLEIESAEINLDSDINLNLDSGGIGIVLAVFVGLIVVIVVVITLCSRYCCNCCDNLCFQGRGRNLHKNNRNLITRGQYGSDYHSNLILPPGYDHGRDHGCPSCGSQMSGYAPSSATSRFSRETGKENFDRFIIPVNPTSKYHPRAIDYCTTETENGNSVDRRRRGRRSKHTTQSNRLETINME